MSTEPASKTCPMCCSEIAAKAKKCPHCHHFQHRMVMLLYHPAFGAALVVIPAIAMLSFVLFVSSKWFDQGEEFRTYSDQIAITESQMVFGDTKSSETVAVLGTMKNSSLVGWKDVLFQVEFFDKDGKRIDTDQKREYPFDIPANETIPFKVSVRREFAKELYAKHAVRIVSAKDARKGW